MRKTTFATMAAAVVCALLATGSPARPAAADPAGGIGIEAGRSAEDAGTAQERAFRFKERGDEFRVRDEIALAAEEYGKALSLYGGFPAEERLTMARYLSWSGRHDEAIRELRKILSETPGNLDARIHLARCLSWKGDQVASLEESSKALAASPGNREALLARADALKWSGNPNAGISIYKDILAKGEDFDTRLGLSQTYLSDGYLLGAREGARLLKPEYPYQKKEVEDFRAEIDNAARPEVEAGYGYYSDSDENRAHRYGLSGSFWTGSWKWGVGYAYTDASGPDRSARDHEFTFSADSRILEWLSIGGTAGYNRPEGAPSDGFPVGGVRAGVKAYDGQLSFSASRNAMTDTAEIIDNRIRYNEFAASVDYPLPYSFSLFASLAGREYSDDNRSTDLQFMVRHVFGLKNPVLRAGYRFRFLDFQRESQSGYFDPSDYVSNRLDLSLDCERGRVYVHAAVFGGYQSFKRRGESPGDFFEGGELLLGMHVTDSFDVELHGEGSDEAGGSASGFRYHLVGARVRARF